MTKILLKTDAESVLPLYVKGKNKVHRRTQNTPMYVAILFLSLANSSTNLGFKTAAHSTKNTFNPPRYKKSTQRRASVMKYLQEQPLNKHPCDEKWSNDEDISTQKISCSPSAPPSSLSEPPTVPPAMQVQLNLSLTYIVGLKGEGRSADQVKDEFNNTINSDLEHGMQQVVANPSQDIISDVWVENSGHIDVTCPDGFSRSSSCVLVNSDISIRAEPSASADEIEIIVNENVRSSMDSKDSQTSVFVDEVDNDEVMETLFIETNESQLAGELPVVVGAVASSSSPSQRIEQLGTSSPRSEPSANPIHSPTGIEQTDLASQSFQPTDTITLFEVIISYIAGLNESGISAESISAGSDKTIGSDLNEGAIKVIEVSSTYLASVLGVENSLYVDVVCPENAVISSSCVSITSSITVAATTLSSIEVGEIISSSIRSSMETNVNSLTSFVSQVDNIFVVEAWFVELIGSIEVSDSGNSIPVPVIASSFAPSTTPSTSVTNQAQPTLSDNSISPNELPTRVNCQGSSQTVTSIGTEFEFWYSVESSSTDTDEFRPQLENAILDSVAMDLLPCLDLDNQISRHLESWSRQLNVLHSNAVGIDSTPSDIHYKEYICVPAMESSNNCYVFQGIMQMLTVDADDSVTTPLIRRSLDSIELAMDNGSLLSSSMPTVFQVSYIENPTSRVDDVDEENTTTTQDINRPDNFVPVQAVLDDERTRGALMNKKQLTTMMTTLILLCVFFLLLCFCYKRKKGSGEERDNAHLQPPRAGQNIRSVSTSSSESDPTEGSRSLLAPSHDSDSRSILDYLSGFGGDDKENSGERAPFSFDDEEKFRTQTDMTLGLYGNDTKDVIGVRTPTNSRRDQEARVLRAREIVNVHRCQSICCAACQKLQSDITFLPSTNPIS